MACFAGICGGGNSESAQKERQLRSEMRELAGKVEAMREQVAEAKALREAQEEDTAEKELQRAQLQAQVSAKETLTKKHKAAQKASERRLCTCFDGYQAKKAIKEQELQWQLETLTNELESLEMESAEVKDRAPDLSKQMQIEKRKSEILRKEAAQALAQASGEVKRTKSQAEMDDDFVKEVNQFRTQTPAVQRQMKGTISELLAELRAAEMLLEEEQHLHKQAESEALEHDEAIEGLNSRLGNGLFENFMGTRKTKTQQWFRSQTPEKQRAIKNELEKCLQEMQGVEVERQLDAIREEQTTKKITSMRQRTQSMEKKMEEHGKRPSFAWNQDDDHLGA